MDKKLALELAELYARHATVVNLIQALEDYSSLAQKPSRLPETSGEPGRHAA